MCHNSCCLLDSELSAVTPLCQYSIFSSYSPLPVLLRFDTVCCRTVKQVINLPLTSCAGRQLSLDMFHKANCPTMKQWPSNWLSFDKQLCGMNTQPRGSCHWAIVSKRLSWICIMSFIIIGGSCHKHDFCCDKRFVVTIVCLSQQLWVCCDKTCLLSWQKYACHDKVLSWQI